MVSPSCTDVDLSASAAAARELGEPYAAEVERSFLEGLERQAVRRSAVGAVADVTIALGSIGLGVVFVLVARELGDLGGTVATIVAWAAILWINVLWTRVRSR